MLTNYKSGRNKGYLYKRCLKCNREKLKALYTKYPWLNAFYSARFRQRRRDEASQLYTTWIQSTKPLPFKVMTEDDWLLACDFFGGCAICGEEHIEVREFFVPFNDGGKYAVHNMFPLCGMCEIPKKASENPFLWHMNSPLKQQGLTTERFDKIVDWLTLQIERAGGKNGST